MRGPSATYNYDSFKCLLNYDGICKDSRHIFPSGPKSRATGVGVTYNVSDGAPT